MPIGQTAQLLRAESEVYLAGFGVVSWNFNPINSTNTSSCTSQTIYATAVPYRAGQVVTNIGYGVGTAASGTNPTGVFVGLCNATTVLAQSANLNANVGWQSVQLVAFALTAPFTITADGLYYHLLLVNGTWGTTQAQMSRGILNYFNLGTPFIAATGGTAATTLPANNAAITLANTGSPLTFFSYST